jgi:hypothetical protein
MVGEASARNTPEDQDDEDASRTWGMIELNERRQKKEVVPSCYVEGRSQMSKMSSKRRANAVSGAGDELGRLGKDERG